MYDKQKYSHRFTQQTHLNRYIAMQFLMVHGATYPSCLLVGDLIEGEAVDREYLISGYQTLALCYTLHIHVRHIDADAVLCSPTDAEAQPLPLIGGLLHVDVLHLKTSNRGKFSYSKLWASTVVAH